MKGTSAELFESLFDETDNVDNDGVGNYRTKTEKAGDFAYVSVFPVWDTLTRREARDAKRKQNKDVIDRHNRRVMQLETEKLMNANFGIDDIILCLTYEGYEQPESDEEAIKDIKNYVRKVRRLRQQRGLPELKFIRTTEFGKRYHHHIIVNKGIDRETLEAMWKHGQVNSRRVQFYKEGLAGFAQYITKQKETQRKCGHSYACSRNLTKPKKTVADHKISAKKIERIAEDIKIIGKEILEKAYKGYELIGDIVVRTSDYAPGAWVYARLRKRDTNRECGAAMPHAVGKSAGGNRARAAAPDTYPQ